MTKRLKSLKMWPLFVAVSAVVIIAGIILYALLGFNASAEKPSYKIFTVHYNVVAELNNKEEEIQDLCESVFEENGLTFKSKSVRSEVAGSTTLETGNKSLIYEFSASASDQALAAAEEAIEKLVLTNDEGEKLDIEQHAEFHFVKGETFYEAGWRAAVAIAVGAFVVLVYIGVRFGVASALSGLVGVVNSSFFTLGIFAIARIPVFAVGPLLYAAIAAISFIILWLLHCIKMRDNFKDPEFGKYQADEAVALSLTASDKFVYWTAGGIALLIALLGAITASSSIALLVLPALLAVCSSLYSAALLSPSFHVYCKRAFDKFKKSKVRVYSGKKKAKEVKTEEEN